MRLADQILAARGSENDERSFGQISFLADLLPDAERFELDEFVTAAAASVALSRPSSVLARLPFGRLWLVWPAAALVGARPDLRDNATPEAPVPRRFGVLLEAADETFQRGAMVFAWAHDPARAVTDEHRRNPLMVCPYALAFDWWAGYDPLITPDHPHWRGVIDGLRATMARPGLHAQRDLKALARDEQREGMALAEMVARHRAVEHPGARRAWAELRTHPPAYQRACETEALGDIQGEGPFVLAVVMLMNSRNAVDLRAEPVPERLQRARERSGKRRLLDYSMVRLRLTRTAGHRADAAGLSRAQMREHLVRGHFKIRRTGIFWWSPFVRGAGGSAGALRRRSYRVTA